MASEEDPPMFLLGLNGELAGRQAEGLPIVGPGFPPSSGDARSFISSDRVTTGGWQES